MADIKVTKTDGVGFMQIIFTRGVDFLEKFKEKMKSISDDRNLALKMKKYKRR